MKTNEMIDLNEISKRVSEIRSGWGLYEKFKRRLAGEARCEALEALLFVSDEQQTKVA